MADKSILAVEIDDAGFKAFQAKFDAYKEATAKLPPAWEESSKQARAVSVGFEAVVAKMAQAQAAIGDLADKAREAGAEQSLALDGWTRINYGAKHLAGHIAGSTLSLAKWAGLTTLFSSILAGGGIFGISRMAMGVSGRRSAAMGYGISYGEAQSYSVNFARLGNAPGLLAGFNSAMTSGEGQAPLISLLGPNAGARMAGKDAAGLMAEALPDLKKLVDNINDPQLLDNILKARGLDKLGVDLNTAMTIRRMSLGEINATVAGFKDDSETMALSTETQRRWQEFETTMERSGAEIENVFAKRLVNIAPAVTRLSDALVKFIDALLSDGGPVEDGLKKLDSWVQWFSAELANPRFEEGIGILADSIARFGSVVFRMGGGGKGDGGSSGPGRHGLSTPGDRHGGGSTPGAGGGTGRGRGGSTGGPTWGSTPTGKWGGGATPGGGASVQTPDQSTWPANTGDAANDAVSQAIGKLGEDRWRDRADLAEYLRTGGHGMDPARVSWCAAFVGATLRKAGLPDIPANRGGNIATSYMRWGAPDDASHPKRGDVLVEGRGLGAGQVGGHVGLATGRVDARGRVEMISGNHSGGVRMSWEDPRRITARQPIAHAGKQNRVEIDNQGGGDVSVQSRPVGPMRPRNDETVRVPH